jgi:hypothetical protein
MTPPPGPAGFSDWCVRLTAEMTEMFDSRRPRSPSVFIDAMIPYRLGLSPRQAARALLNLEPRLFDRLLAASRRGSASAEPAAVTPPDPAADPSAPPPPATPDA